MIIEINEKNLVMYISVVGITGRLYIQINCFKPAVGKQQ